MVTFSATKLLSAEQAARVIGVSRSRISHYVKGGRLVPDPVVYASYRRLMFSAAHVKAFRRRPPGFPKGGKRKTPAKIPA